ncbi:MAG: ABC transporter substrate-binding protein [Paenibacillus sp.]|nr:ABC transporter substrate-binding protein [Paenibacillus sp.]
MTKKWKMLCSLLLIATLLLSACSGNNTKGKEEDAVNSSGNKVEEPTELTVAFPLFGSVPKDMALIQDAVNEVTLKKINAKVELLPINFSSWQQQMNLMLSSDEKLDLIAVVGSFTQFMSKNQLIPLDKLLDEQGEGILKALDPDYLKAGKVNNAIYAVPTLRDMATSYGISMRKDLVEKYKIDVEKINNFADLEEPLKVIKAGEPNLAPLLPPTFSSVINALPTYDTLIDRIGVLMNHGDNLKVVDLFETEEYAQQLQLVRKWYEEGLILKDATTNKVNENELINSNRGFATLTVINPMSYANASNGAGYPRVIKELLPSVSMSSTLTNAMWGVPVTSKVPEKAMEFLNLMYTDKELVNILDYGIEGKHYVVKSDNIIDFPPGVDGQNSGYNLNYGWLFGNQFLSYVWNGTDPDIWKKVQEFNDSAIKSKALGFSFDPTPVKTEYANVSNVVGQYFLPLETGSVDPEKILPQFIDKLKTAGIDKVIAEKQKQLDKWAEDNK